MSMTLKDLTRPSNSTSTPTWTSRSHAAWPSTRWASWVLQPDHRQRAEPNDRNLFTCSKIGTSATGPRNHPVGWTRVEDPLLKFKPDLREREAYMQRSLDIEEVDLADVYAGERC